MCTASRCSVNDSGPASCAEPQFWTKSFKKPSAMADTPRREIPAPAGTTQYVARCDFDPRCGGCWMSRMHQWPESFQEVRFDCNPIAQGTGRVVCSGHRAVRRRGPTNAKPGTGHGRGGSKGSVSQPTGALLGTSAWTSELVPLSLPSPSPPPLSPPPSPFPPPPPLLSPPPFPPPPLSPFLPPSLPLLPFLSPPPPPPSPPSPRRSPGNSKNG